MQRIIVSVTPTSWQLSTVSQLLTRSSQISTITSQIQSPYPLVLNAPMAQLGWRLIPYTAHPGFGVGTPSVHTDARASWCPGEVDGRRAHISQLYLPPFNCQLSIPSRQLPISTPRIPIISPQLNTRVRIKSLESKSTNSMFKLKC